MKIGDKAFRAVLDTGATLSIVARRLLKRFRKTKTVAIRVGDWRTINSLGGVDVTICLGDETVTQLAECWTPIHRHWYRLPTKKPPGKNAVSLAPLFFALRLWQWALFRTFGAVRTKIVWAALHIQG